MNLFKNQGWTRVFTWKYKNKLKNIHGVFVLNLKGFVFRIKFEKKSFSGTGDSWFWFIILLSVQIVNKWYWTLFFQARVIKELTNGITIMQHNGVKSLYTLAVEEILTTSLLINHVSQDVWLVHVVIDIHCLKTESQDMTKRVMTGMLCHS